MLARVSLTRCVARASSMRRSPSTREIVKIDPSASDARFGRAMALVRLRRFAERGPCSKTPSAVHPEQPGLAHALARLLASAPDDAVRDGHRALSIMQSLEKTRHHPWR
jgi:hypothetical protein